MKLRKPILALDVDGPIVTFGVDEAEDVYECFADGVPVTIPRRVPEFLRQLHLKFQIVWYTSWKRTANQSISPLVGLPTNLPVIDFDRYGTVKLGESRKFLGLLGWLKDDMAVAVVDDEIGLDMIGWANERAAPTVLVEVDPRIGIQEHQVAELLRFGDTLGTAE